MPKNTKEEKEKEEIVETTPNAEMDEYLVAEKIGNIGRERRGRFQIGKQSGSAGILHQPARLQR